MNYINPPGGDRPLAEVVRDLLVDDYGSSLDADDPSAELLAAGDSLDLVELALTVERVFGWSVGDDDLAKWRTVGDVQSYCAVRAAGGK